MAGVAEALLVIGLVAVVCVCWWAIEWSRTRSCPRCGRRVMRGQMTCSHCAFDFRRIA